MKKILLSLLTMSLCVAGFAQTAASYSFSSSTGTYSSISGTGTSLTAAAGDDMTASAVPLGFSFSFCGNTYSSVSVCSNGWASFLSTSSVAYSNAIANLGGISPVLMPFWCDLNGATGHAYYQTTGTAPNRVFTVEYNNWSYYMASSTLNFQVQLHETTNEVDFCYGANAFSVTTAAVVGIAGSGTDYSIFDSTTATSTVYYDGTSVPPANGTILTWNAPAAACSGTPAAGTSTAIFSPSCGNNSVTLGLTGYTSGTGISYQWQSSSDGVTWTDIAGATGATEVLPFTSTVITFYHCVTTCSGSGLSATSSLSSVAPNLIAGDISFTGLLADSVSKVWLIQFNPADSSLTAVDSTFSCTAPSGAQYYQFVNEPAGTYMAKAKDIASVPGTSGYIPTYSLSTPYWGTAASATHGATYDMLNIAMMYGTVPAGPGFIGGLIVSGAGKNTSGDVPVAGMLVYLRDASGTILTYTYTDASGAYSFSGIANGTYTIYPEDMGFVTTPSASIVLTSTAETANAVNFKEHTIAKTVTPYTGITGIPVAAATVMSVYPNPAGNDLNIVWAAQATGDASVIVKDVTGRVVMSNTVDLQAASGKTKLDVSALTNGIYFISLNAAGANYSTKFAIQK